MVKKCLVSVFSRPSAALALSPQPKWHALAQKMSMHAANAMEPTARPWGIFMPARVRTEWARPRKTGMVVFHWAFSQNRWGFGVFGIRTRGCWNFERELQGRPRRSSRPRDRRKFAEPIGSKAQSSEMDEFQLRAKAELFPDLSETEESRIFLT